MKILFFTESLICGGKERRMIELIQYLKLNSDHEISLVLMEKVIQYEYFYDLGIPVSYIERKHFKYDPEPFFKFYKYCLSFEPDIIHTWTKMSTFYAIPAKLLCRIPLLTNMIADAQLNFKLSFMDHFFYPIDFYFANTIISNSKAGLDAYKVNNSKAMVIWNGVNLERFKNRINLDAVRSELNVTTKYMIVMVASFSKFKDYDLFLDIAKEMGRIRSDVSFVGVGDGSEYKRILKRINDEMIKNVFLPGRKNEVENIISASDIGILCTFSEGISNAIIEYMALGKPVISTDTQGGSKEIIVDGETGYCIERDSQKIVPLLDTLLDNPELRNFIGNKAKERISTHFSILKMGNEFEQVYKGFLKPVKN